MTEREKDLLHLEALHRIENEGQTNDAVGKALNLSRGAMAGIRYRMRQEAAKAVCKCRRKANRDGGMPERWWA